MSVEAARLGRSGQLGIGSWACACVSVRVRCGCVAACGPLDVYVCECEGQVRVCGCMWSVCAFVCSCTCNGSGRRVCDCMWWCTFVPRAPPSADAPPPAPTRRPRVASSHAHAPPNRRLLPRPRAAHDRAHAPRVRNKTCAHAVKAQRSRRQRGRGHGVDVVRRQRAERAHRACRRTQPFSRGPVAAQSPTRTR